METKKNPKHDLTRMSGYFFSVGLLISVSIVIAAFEWKTYGDDVADLQQRAIDDFNPIMDPPRTEIIPPKPKAVLINPVIREVDDKESVKDIQFKIDFTTDTAQYVALPEPQPEPEDDIVMDFLPLEQSASPKDGFRSFYQYMALMIKYPAPARRMGIEGKVFVEFVVERDGSFSNTRVIKGIGGGCDEEALRVMQTAPPWNPGKQRGKPVRQRYTMPIYFKLQ